MSRWSEERAGFALTLGAALLWGTSWVATGFALRGFSPLAVAGWRGLVGLAFIAVYLGLRPAGIRGDHDRPPVARAARVLLLGLLGGGAFQVGLAYAVDLSGATLAAFVAGLYPILVAAGAGLVLGERLGRFVLGGLIIAFGGVVLLAGFDPTGTSPVGLAIGLGAAAAFAAYLLLARRWASAWSLPTPLIATSVLAMTALVALPLALLTDPAGLVPGGGAVPILAILWLAGPVGAIAQAAAVAGVRRLPSDRSAAIFLLNPLTAALLAAALLGERLGPLQVVGCGLVLAGVALATVMAARVARAAAAARAAGPAQGEGTAARRIL
ncbi:MAG TPA: DMT family transporter [Candidatus Limnocylindrales bacterium]